MNPSIQQPFAMFAFAIRLTCVVIVLATGGFCCGAQVRVEVSSKSPQVAEPFWLTIKVAADDSASVVFPDVPASIGSFDVLSHRDWFNVPEGSHRTWTRNFELECLQGGELRIPSLQVMVDGQTLESEPVTLAVVSEVEAEATPYNFRDIKPPMEIPPAPVRNSKWVVLAAAGGALLSVLAVVGWLFYRKREISPGDWALQELDQLRNSDEFRSPNALAVSAKLADIMRQYIERRFGIQATRQTTSEFLAEAQGDARLDESQRSTLKEFLQEADEIKFARSELADGKLDDSCRLVENFVRASAGGGK